MTDYTGSLIKHSTTCRHERRNRNPKMDGYVYKQTGVNFIFLILTISGGFRLALAQTQSLQNVTQFLAQSSYFVIQCTVSSTNQPSWFMYEPAVTYGKIVIYNALTQANMNSAKYSIGTGSNNYTLTVMNIQLTDALTYCCTVDGLDDFCSNVVLIDYLSASVNPSNGVNPGDNVNISCYLSYNAPSKHIDAPFPLSDSQDPILSMYIGQTQMTNIPGAQVNTATAPKSKLISYNRTIAYQDAGMNLTCTISSASSPPLNNQSTTPMNVYSATRTATIIYPNGTKSSNNVYALNSVFTCVGDGYPAPTVDWLDRNMNSLNRRNQGSTTWTPSGQGTFNLYCSASNTLSQNATLNQTVVIVGQSVGSSGVKTALSTLLTAACLGVLFVASNIF